MPTSWSSRNTPTEEQQEMERRNWSRYPIKISDNIKCLLRGIKKFTATVENISVNGICLATKSSLVVGTVFEALIPWPNEEEEQRIKVRVDRVTPQTDGGYHLGCSMVHYSDPPPATNS